MFIGREAELAVLESLYNSNCFEFLVMYGRRRVGKTEVLKQFAAKHKCLLFSALEQSNFSNLENFSHSVGEYFDENFLPVFQNWQSAFDYLDAKIEKHSASAKTVVIIDEFPYIAKAFPAIKSILQHIIDHKWKDKNILLVLCGSSVSFMLNEVMGQSSPLYGRKTSQLEIKPFDYLTSALFVPKYSNLDKVITYGILGGIPKYLETFSDKLSIWENVEKVIASASGSLHEEPGFLLRMEFREPTLYNTILDAIATGASKMNEIATKIQEESSKSNKYLTELQTIKLVEKIVPCGEKDNSKKTIYILRDNFFKFWYRYMFRNKNRFNLMKEREIAEFIMQDINNFMGRQFEIICTEYLIRLAKTKKLPFIPAAIGKWWGNNPSARREADIDILVLSDDENSAIICECKFRNEKFDLPDLAEMTENAKIFAQVESPIFYIFSRSGVTKAVEQEIAQKNLNVKLFGVDDLFAD